jgi:hypothetical protein
MCSPATPGSREFELARAGGRAAQQRFHAGGQLSHSERLGEVVIAADFESDHLVEFGVTRREEQHRDARVDAQPPTHLVPVDSRQHDIEHHEVEGGGLRERQCVIAVRGYCDVVALFAQVVADELGDRSFVIDDEDAGGSVGQGEPPGSRRRAVLAGQIWRRLGRTCGWTCLGR